MSKNYSAFHQYGQAKFAFGGSILSSSQFLLLPQLPQKTKVASKAVKNDSKVIISFPSSNSVKRTVESKLCSSKTILISISTNQYDVIKFTLLFS
jgi:hypothetical protein